MALPSTNKPFAVQKALDIKRLVEGGVLCRSKFARLFNTVSIKTGAVYEINCKSWRCKRHREKWGRKWHMIIGESLKKMDITLLVNLTTAEMIDNETAFKALRRFMYRFRVKFGPTEYIRVVEYNKKHTQPHFHMLLSCEDLKLSTMPARFREMKNLSWPNHLFEFIRSSWSEALRYYAPDKKLTSVVWCQPPATAGAAAGYAIGYVTGKNDKNEEPDNTWKGRKITFSKKWFERPTSQIWKEILTRLFGEGDPDDRFFWVPNDAERIIGESPLDFENCAIMKQRFFEAQYYSEHGFFPLIVEPDHFDPVYYDILTTGQEVFNSV